MRLKRGQRSLHGIDDLHGVGARLALHRQDDGSLAVVTGVGLDSLEAVFHRGHVTQANRVAVAIADDQLGELGGVAQLSVRLHGQCLLLTFECADGSVDIGRRQRGADFVQRDVACRQRLGQHTHPHGVALLAVDIDLGDPFKRRQRGRDQVLGVVVQIRQAH